MTFNIEEIVSESRAKREEIMNLIDQGFLNQFLVSYEIPSEVSFLEGKFGKEFLEEYNEVVEKEYDNHFCLKNILKYKSDIVKGSNPFAVILANQILNKYGFETVTQGDLEKAIHSGFDMEEKLVDTGFVFRSHSKYMGNSLFEHQIENKFFDELEEKGIKFSRKNPLWVPLNSLELEKQENLPKVSFKLKNDAKVYNIPFLRYKNNNRFYDFGDINKDTGFPDISSKGSANRKLDADDSGLRRAYLKLTDDFRYGWNYAGTDDEDFLWYPGYGRIVVKNKENKNDI